MNPEKIRDWQAIFRDIVMTIVAVFMLVFETVYATVPNPVIIGAGLTLLGIPSAVRLDILRRKSSD